MVLEGFTYAEIAETLEIAPNALALRLSRAKAALKSAMERGPMSEIDLDHLGDVWRAQPDPAEIERLRRSAEAVRRARAGARSRTSGWPCSSPPSCSS